MIIDRADMQIRLHGTRRKKQRESVSMVDSNEESTFPMNSYRSFRIN